MALIPLFFKASRFKVVVQQANTLSDAVLSLPVLAALKQNYKHVQIVVICAPESAELFRNHPDVASVLVVLRNDLGLIRNQEELEVQLRAENADLYLELWSNLKLAILARKCGIRVRIGDTTAFLPIHFFTHGVRSGRDIITRHNAEMSLKILDRLNSISRLPHLQIPVPPLAMDAADEQMATLRKSGNSVVGIDVSTDASGVAIPHDVIRGTVSQLTAKGHHVALFGGLDDQTHFADLAGSNVSLFFDSPLADTFALISKVDVFFGNASGLSQMASYAQRPMLMFLPRKADFPSRVGPLSPVFKVLRQDTLCVHSPKQNCSPNLCWKWLTPDTVVTALTDVLARSKTPSRWTFKAIKTQHLLASIRVLWAVQTPEEYFRAVTLKADLESGGLHIFPILIRGEGWGSVIELIHFCEQYNITVIHGRINPAVGSMIKGVMGTVRQYVMPQVLNENPLRQKRSAENWIRIYHQLWDPAAGV